MIDIDIDEKLALVFGLTDLIALMIMQSYSFLFKVPKFLINDGILLHDLPQKLP